jgi:folate-dependent tRNA-U54 methylase TrmFO/GidA
MNSNFGLLEPLPGQVRKDQRRAIQVARARSDFAAWREQHCGSVLGAVP